jgi:integrase/recombinase XerD
MTEPHRRARGGVGAEDRVTVPDDLLSSWSSSMQFGGLAPATIRTRVGALRRLNKARGPLAEITRPQLMAWLGAFTRASTRSTNLSYVRCLFDWATTEGYVAVDPARHLPKVKAASDAEAGARRSAWRCDGNATDQERLWLELMAYAGLRVSEVAACRPGDAWLNVDGVWWLRIPRGKSGHDQQVPVPRWLGEWLSMAEPWTVGVQAVYRHSKALLEAAGSTSTPHACRHFYATAALHSTGNIRVVQQMLRHADVSTTARYTMVTSQEMVDAAEGLPRFA